MQALFALHSVVAVVVESVSTLHVVLQLYRLRQLTSMTWCCCWLLAAAGQ
jgi:hypothetical protein